MPEAISVSNVFARALRANGEQVMLLVSGDGEARMYNVENVDELADSLTLALIGRENYRAHIQRAMLLEQLMGRRGHEHRTDDARLCHHV